MSPIDEEFDADTEAAIERWQAMLGVEVTGEVALGDIVFVPTLTEVRSIVAEEGSTVGDGDQIVTLGGSAIEVVIEVPDELESTLAAGTAVQVDDAEGVVSVLRSGESADGTVGVQAVIAPTAELAARPGDAVTVRLDITLAGDVLIVPAEAIVSRIDGTFAVQTDAATFVTVEVAAVAGGDAGITSDALAADDEVLVPA
jgi:hypothetical protein